MISNWLLRTSLLCIMNAWTAFCGRIVRSSVWTPTAALLRWSAETIWSLFHFCALWNPLLPSINQSSSECGLFTIFSFLVHPNCAQILKSCLYFQNHTSLFFYIWFLLVWLYQFTAHSFWNLLLTSVTKQYAHHLPFP